MAKKKKNESSKKQSPNAKSRNLRAIYAQLRREFTAADLQKFTELDQRIPFDKVIAEMEEVHRKIVKKRA